MRAKAWLRALAPIALLLTLSARALPAATPTLPAPACVVTAQEFAGWKNTAGKIPAFTAPDSAAFAPSDNCSFYKWSARMFLWLTSRDHTGKMEMFSPTFYNAIESSSTGAFRLVRNPAGLGASDVSNLVFLVRVNKPKVLLLRLHGTKSPKHNDANATGQAGGGVLVVKGKPIPVPHDSRHATYPVVYYAILVNDVFAGLQAHQADVAYYTKGDHEGEFPTTVAQVEQIEKASGTTYLDRHQLALELKTSWIDTAYLTRAQAKGLLTIRARVPAFTQAQDSKGHLQLNWDGHTTTTRTLALVGLHLVGAAKDHPDMIWATFESGFNTPDNDYSYLNRHYDWRHKSCPPSASCLSTIDLSSTTKLPTLFYTGPAGASLPPYAIAETASSSNDNTTITSTSAAPTPTDVVRLNPWGDQQPAQQSEKPALDDRVVRNNTMLLSLQESLQARLAHADDAKRANYFLAGSLWSDDVKPPYSSGPRFGSLYLANTTMETFQQVSPQNHDPNATAQNCLSCHRISADSSGNLPPGTSISHVFPNVTH